MIAFLRKPIVTVSLVGIGSVVVVVVIHKIRNR
ncbi:membrane protein [Mycobacterium tuberculosis]|nr:membrane protein [Mycobacterium tuberculosis]